MITAMSPRQRVWVELMKRRSPPNTNLCPPNCRACKLQQERAQQVAGLYRYLQRIGVLR